MKKIFNGHWLLIASVIIFSLSVFPSILKGYSAFTYDNGRDMLEAYKILYEKNFTLIGPTTGIPGVFHGAWAFYWLIIPFVLFGGHPIGVAFMMAVINLLGLIIFYVLLKDLFNKKIAGIASLLYATSPHILAHSVQLAHNNLLPFLTSLSLFFLYRYLKNRSRVSLFVFGLTIGFLFEFEFGGGLFVLLYDLIFLSLYLFFDKKSFQEFFLRLGIFMVATVTPMIPRFIFELRHDFLMTQNLVNNLLHPQIRFEYFRHLPFGDRVINRLELFFNLWKDIFPPVGNLLAVILLIAVVLAIIRNLRLLTGIQNRLIKYLLGLIVFVLSAWIYYKDAVWHTYTSGFPIYFLLGVGYGLFLINKKLPQLVSFAFVILFLYSIINLVTHNAFFSHGIDDQSAIDNQLKAIDYIYANEPKNNFAVGVYSPSWFSYPYDYWFLWREKFMGMPRPKSLWTAKTNYLIVEPADNETTARIWFDKFMNKNARLVSEKYFGRLKVEKWSL